MSGDAGDHPPTPGELYAFDAGNVATQLWNSNMNAARDAPGNFAKMVPPLVANGRVYLATWSQQVAVYGLGALSPAAAPTFNPAAGTYNNAQSVQLASSTPGASFFYTTNGTTPSTSSTPYTGPIAVNSSMTIKAIATASGFSSSAVSSAAYTINGSSTPVAVSLGSSANVDAMVNNGSAVPNGGLDGDGYAYSATLLGTSLVWNGNNYLFGAAGSADAVSNTTVPLPAGTFTT
ncbi:MAG: chitobiase/beta-hexosaminidase C-terminal domain-containing protein, partial [Gammaproteobacteria bacterium]|nr:chitobiase/beta-hexosaminidase C-terminal domain-containing protein [Gammaproteobacteria bacterium]